MIIIFDYFETLVHNKSMDFSRGLKAMWEKYYKDKCSFDEISAYGEELFRHLQEIHKQGLEYAFVKDELPAYAEKYGGDTIKMSAKEEADFLMQCNKMEHMPHIPEALAELDKMGIPMYVLSNSGFTADALSIALEKLGIRKYFKKVWSSADYGKIKPSRDFFEMAIEAVLSDNPTEKREDIVFVGDTYNSDVKGANSAGIDVIWINHKDEENAENLPIHSIRNTSELVDTTLAIYHQTHERSNIMEIKKVALLGAGAVGAYFIWGLAEKLGENFCVVAKGLRKERLEKEGLIINEKHYALSVKSPDEVGNVDLLLVSCKQDGLADMLEDIKSMTGENTMVLSLLNGVTSEEIIGNAIGMEHILYSVMRIASVREGNQITFSPENTAGVFVGEKGISTPTERILAVEKLFQDTPIRYTFKEDIILDMWLKYASNISQNLPQAILGVGCGAYEDSPHVNHIAACLWKEVAQVANAKGIPLSPELALFHGVNPKARFSTLQDIDAGRHTEIEMFAGEMMQMGKEHSIPVPYCEYTYHLIKALEEKNDDKFNY